MVDNIQNPEGNEEAATSETPDSIHDASQSLESDISDATDSVDEELKNLVEDLGPQSKEAELLADLQRLQAEFAVYRGGISGMFYRCQTSWWSR